MEKFTEDNFYTNTFAQTRKQSYQTYKYTHRLIKKHNRRIRSWYRTKERLRRARLKNCRHRLIWDSRPLFRGIQTDNYGKIYRRLQFDSFLRGLCPRTLEVYRIWFYQGSDAESLPLTNGPLSPE